MPKSFPPCVYQDYSPVQQRKPLLLSGGGFTVRHIVSEESLTPYNDTGWHIERGHIAAHNKSALGGQEPDVISACVAALFTHLDLSLGFNIGP
jgi:hypothetical protein